MANSTETQNEAGDQNAAENQDMPIGQKAAFLVASLIVCALQSVAMSLLANYSETMDTLVVPYFVVALVVGFFMSFILFWGILLLINRVFYLEMKLGLSPPGSDYILEENGRLMLGLVVLSTLLSVLVALGTSTSLPTFGMSELKVAKAKLDQEYQAFKEREHDYSSTDEFSPGDDYRTQKEEDISAMILYKKRVLQKSIEWLKTHCEDDVFVTSPGEEKSYGSIYRGSENRKGEILTLHAQLENLRGNRPEGTPSISILNRGKISGAFKLCYILSKHEGTESEFMEIYEATGFDFNEWTEEMDETFNRGNRIERMEEMLYGIPPAIDTPSSPPTSSTPDVKPVGLKPVAK